MSDSTQTEAQSPTSEEPGLHLKATKVDWDPKTKRFDVFLIDTGWNEPVSKMVRSHLPMYFGDHNPDPLYILSPEQSVAVLKIAPELIGHDPIVVVYDLYSPHGKKRNKFRGFRLNVGLMKNAAQALTRLQDFTRFVFMHRKSTCLENEIARELHREGVDGMIKILREASTELL